NFEPVPLIKLLEKQGFHTYVKSVDAETIETYFYKIGPVGPSKTEVDVQEEVSPSEDWQALLKKYEGRRLEIDVRHLEMPMPMMTILESLEILTPQQELYVYHKRIPVFLLSELKERGFVYRIK